MKFLGITLSLFAAAFFFTTASSAVEFTIEGNADGSENSINFESSSQTNVTQSNQMDVSNDVDANANTGGNTTDNGSVQTGDASVFVKIKNFFNMNSADVDDCCPEGVTPTPIQSGPTPTVYDPGQPTPTPTTTTTTTSTNPSSNNGGVGGPSGEVLGLSAASGEGTTEALFYTLGTLCLALASAIWRYPKKLIA